jgi:sec-independent protein translocase protein TatC
MPETPDKQNDSQDPRPDVSPEHDGRLTSDNADSHPDHFDQDDGPVEDWAAPAEPSPVTAVTTTPPPTPPAKSSPPVPEPEPDDPEEEGMLRMSFLDHLEELRSRILRALGGLVAAFAICIFFTDALWKGVHAPAAAALTQLGYSPDLAQLTPTEAFTVIWVRLPLLAGLFLASPWIIFQVWGFISPGLYKKERRLAVPFIFTTAGLFILGGAFAYLVAFRFGLVFLLGIGSNMGVKPVISLTEYFDLFVNVILGVALVFELPVLIFFLTLLRVASPRFLLAHSRYAILLIVVAAAIITPTPDVVNLTIFAAPMILLYFVGIFASYLLVLNREGEKFPWKPVLKWTLGILAGLSILFWLAVTRLGYHWIAKWPFLIK